MPWLEGPSGIVLAVVVGLALLYALVQLVQWNFRVALRLKLLELKDAELAEQLASLRPARSLHDELAQLLGKTVTTRLDALGAEDLALLDQAIRQRLPELVAPVLQSASPRFSDAFAAGVEERALAHVPAALASAGPQIAAALHQRLQATLADPDSAAWEHIDERLGRRLVGLAEELPAEAAARLDEKVRAALVSRVDEMLESPDDFSDLFERIDEKLQGHILATVAQPPEECVRGIATRAAGGMAARVADMFDSPGDHGDLFEGIDEKLGARILELAGDPPDEIAQKRDQRICAELLAELDHICENPGEHEELYQGIDEKLGERMLELAGDLPEETARQLDERICAELLAELDQIRENSGDYADLYESIDEKLSGRILAVVDNPPAEMEQRLAERTEGGLLAAVDHLFENRDEHEDFFSDLDEKLGQRIRRRLREGFSGEAGDRVDAAIDETLLAHTRARLQAANLAELDRVIGQRLEALAANAPGTAERIDERLREELAARAANQRRESAAPTAEAAGDRPTPARQFTQCLEEWVGAALEQARPALKSALESWLSHQEEGHRPVEGAGKNP
jgi:hypothetical protein